MCQCVVEPELCPVVSGAKEVYVPEFGSSLSHRVGEIMGTCDFVGFMQCGEAIFVQTPKRMDERLGKHEPRADAQLRRMSTVSKPHRRPQRVDASLECACGNCR